MATIEALYEFSDVSGISAIISSQELVGESGWDYANILSALYADPEMSVDEFAEIIVSTFKDFYKDSVNQEITISALRAEIIREIARETDALAGQLIELLESTGTRDDTLAIIEDARKTVQEIDPYINPYVYVDLADLDARLGFDTQIAILMDEAVISEYHGNDLENVNGMSIVFFRLPEATPFNTFDTNYTNYDSMTNIGNKGDFINQFRWDEFLFTYYSYAGLLP
jgi:hypothetical protein